ncbi:MAG TPA: glycosyltransferase [Bacteroidota bacterium]|nr:glycosyltransferase [Bacteroidota bacterium]
MNNHARFKMRLAVVGAPAHWIGSDGTYWAYEPYVREMRVWADLFSHVQVCGHAGEGEIRGNLAPYNRSNIEVVPVAYSREYGFTGMLQRMFQFPGLVMNIRRAIHDHDFVLMRSPSHFGLVGAALVRLMNRSSITKWAGENGAFTGERIPSRVNRWLESIRGETHFTLVYGPPRYSHQISFLPALMNEEELSEARQLSSRRSWRTPMKILCVGRLEAAKGFDLALRGLGELKRLRPDLMWHFTLVGDGTQNDSLRRLAAECDLTDRMTFTGALPFNEVQKRYAESHIAIMPGTKEGWPKIIAEAWAHGTIPVAASAGLVPSILQDKSSGVVFKPTPSDLVHELAHLLDDPKKMKDMSQGLYRHAQELSLDQFKIRLERILVDRFGFQ